MDYELQRLREDKEAKEKASRVEIWRLKAEIQKLTAPPPKPKSASQRLKPARLVSSLTQRFSFPPPCTQPKPKPKGLIDLDEEPGGAANL